MHLTVLRKAIFEITNLPILGTIFSSYCGEPRIARLHAARPTARPDPDRTQPSQVLLAELYAGSGMFVHSSSLDVAQYDQIFTVMMLRGILQQKFVNERSLPFKRNLASCSQG
jgi:hypothetical protein